MQFLYDRLLLRRVVAAVRRAAALAFALVLAFAGVLVRLAAALAFAGVLSLAGVLIGRRRIGHTLSSVVRTKLRAVRRSGFRASHGRAPEQHSRNGRGEQS